MSITKIYILCIGLFLHTCMVSKSHYEPWTIMIDPSGDARQPGRLIDDTLERGITLQYAQALKDKLEETCPCSVIITRDAGEIVYPLQNASFANRLDVDLYVSIQACYTPKSKSCIDLYVYSTNDYIPQRTSNLSMIPLNKAYQTHHDQTHAIARAIQQTCTSSYPNVSIRGIFALPVASLRGINTPALGLELLLASKDDWLSFVEPIAISIAQHLDR